MLPQASGVCHEILALPWKKAPLVVAGQQIYSTNICPFPFTGWKTSEETALVEKRRERIRRQVRTLAQPGMIYHGQSTVLGDLTAPRGQFKVRVVGIVYEHPITADKMDRHQASLWTLCCVRQAKFSCTLEISDWVDHDPAKVAFARRDSSGK